MFRDFLFQHLVLLHQKFFFNNDINDGNNNCSERRNSRFLTIFSLCRKLSSTSTLKWPMRSRVQIMCSTYSAHHMQHVMCHVVQRDSSAIKFDGVEITFILAVFYWLNHYWWRRRGNQVTRRKPLTMSVRKYQILEPENSSPKRDWNPHCSICGSLGKQTY